MVTQGERQNFLWRPNTNDSTTLARYDQEAQHWVKAFKSASRPQTSLSGALYGIGVILNFILALLWVVFNILGSVAAWLFADNSSRVNRNPMVDAPPMPSDKELDAMYENMEVTEYN